MPREILYKRIEQRCDEMIEKGFLEEVEKLKEMGFENNHSASQAIGYRQALEFLKSERKDSDKLKFICDFKQASKRYVKRQFTWFKKDPNFRWLDVSELSKDKIIEYILQDYEQSF